MCSPVAPEVLTWLGSSSRGALRVEVEDEPVRPVQVRDSRPPEMQRDRAEVCHVAERLDVVHDEVVDVPLRVVRVNALGADPRGGELGGVLLEEGLPRDPVGVAREDQGAVAEVGQEIRRHRLVVGDEVGLGIAFRRPENLFRVGDLHHLALHRGPRRRFSFLAARPHRGLGGRKLDWLLPPAFLGPPVIPEPLEGGMADAAVGRPVGEAHLADEPRLHPVVPAARRRALRER